MFGKNQIMKPVIGTGEWLDIVKIFPTIQGEGPRVGQPAIFIRLGGCNLACSFCDTEFDEFEPMGVDDILDKVAAVHVTQKLIVITGGEPLRQPIEKLCQCLIDRGFIVQIETNGTLFRDLPEQVEIVCSPKQRMQIRADLLARITAFKFVISKGLEGFNSIPDVGQKAVCVPIYVQPMDEYDAVKNSQNQEYVQKLVIENNYIFSVQLHKILGVE